MLRWFGNRLVQDFAKSLAQDFVARFPPQTIEVLLKDQPELFAPANSKKSVSREYEKLTALITRSYQHARDFRREHKLGVLKTAKLSKSFQDEMIRLGYPDVFAKELTLGLAKALI